MDLVKNLVKQYRTYYNLTQKQLAEKVDLNETTIRNIEKGKKLRVRSMIKISDFFNVRVSQIFDLDKINITENK